MSKPGKRIRCGLLEDHYRLLEKDLSEPIIHAHPLFKVLPDIDALNTWQMRLGDAAYHNYLQDNQPSHLEVYT